MKNFYGRLMLDIEGETLSNEEKKLISNPLNIESNGDESNGNESNGVNQEYIA